ncbi:penicillin-binding protein [Aerococcus agrisoli]|uniref:Penicillin-binding protein n=1 Tax=Aerococcus agrisoli TaxID=2487350 RepID=A0A3N4GND6_9LACT|nr:transglycosylase domain-containing protein [Aerococcus agrisoli]RPA60120.1 penicillin-binding protein [Aerococcus agrisoli]
MKKNIEEKKVRGENMTTKDRTVYYLNVFFKVLSKLALVVIVTAVLGGSLVLGLGSGYFLGLVEDMPIPTDTELASAVSNAGEISTMQYSDGSEISSIRADLVRVNTTLDNVSPYIVNGLVATEDENFFEHEGVVPSAIIRAATSTFLGVGGSSGGSTITQQLIKQKLLTNEVSFDRKAKEILLALRLENHYSKEQILQGYLNESPYGRNNKGENIAGIETAAQGIFGVSAKDVTLAQAAFLVGIPQNPYTYTPFLQSGELKESDYLTDGVTRSHEVLQRMRLTNMITEEEYQTAINYDITQDFISPASTEDVPEERNSYIYQAVELQTIEILMEQMVEADGLTMADVDANVDLYNQYYAEADSQMRNGGLTIKATVDPEIYETMNTTVQEYAASFGTTYYSETTDEATGETVEVVEPVQNGTVLLDNDTGQILGFVGGIDFDMSQVDHALSVRRQPGSSMKPILTYGPALQEQIAGPNTMLADTYMRVEQADGTIYEPTNFGTSLSNGFVTARYALSNSMNNPTLYLYNEMLKQGVDIQSYAYKMGLQDAIASDEFGHIALSLGGTSTGPTVLENAAAFATFANGGVYVEPYLVETITDSNGNVVYQHQAHKERVFDEDVAYVIADVLRDATSAGSMAIYKAQMDADLDWIMKTGTTENFRDLWANGSTPTVTLTSWIGYDNTTQERDLYSQDENAVYGTPAQRSLRYWTTLGNRLDYYYPNTMGSGEIHEQPDSVHEETVVTATGTKAGSFSGPYGTTYTIPSTAATNTELFTAAMEPAEAHFDFAIDGKVDEYVSVLETYRSKTNSSVNTTVQGVLQAYRLRLAETEARRQELAETNIEEDG